MFYHKLVPVFLLKMNLDWEQSKDITHIRTLKPKSSYLWPVTCDCFRPDKFWWVLLYLAFFDNLQEILTSWEKLCYIEIAFSFHAIFVYRFSQVVTSFSNTSQSNEWLDDQKLKKNTMQLPGWMTFLLIKGRPHEKTLILASPQIYYFPGRHFGRESNMLTRSSWLSCALRDDEAVYWL